MSKKLSALMTAAAIPLLAILSAAPSRAENLPIPAGTLPTPPRAEFFSFQSLTDRARKTFERKIYESKSKDERLMDLCLDIQHNLLDRLERKGIKGFLAVTGQEPRKSYCAVTRYKGTPQQQLGFYIELSDLPDFDLGAYDRLKPDAVKEKLEQGILRLLSDNELALLAGEKPAVSAPQPE